MVDSALLPAIRAAIRQNELGAASPYCLSYARLGSSGASFGIFQGDTNVNPRARTTLTDVLNAAGTDDATVTRIVGAVSRPLPEGCPLAPADRALTDQALETNFGQAIVDQMDDQLMQTVLHGIDTCVTASASRPIEAEAQLYMALWINMTGAPTSLAKWLGGETVDGLAPPDSASVGIDDIESYLKASAYFRENPRNFAHMQASVATGTALLPAAATV